jgi:hypothetical protein
VKANHEALIARDDVQVAVHQVTARTALGVRRPAGLALRVVGVGDWCVYESVQPIPECAYGGDQPFYHRGLLPLERRVIRIGAPIAMTNPTAARVPRYSAGSAAAQRASVSVLGSMGAMRIAHRGI